MLIAGARKTGLGDSLTDLTSGLTSQLETAATNQAQAYAAQFYDQNAVAIWAAGLTLLGWMIWVSTRETC